MTPFAGYEMPLHYGSQIAEHQAVREQAGMFDVSHMLITDMMGPDSRALLRRLLSNDVAKLEKVGQGKALYSVMLNEAGGVIDDLIVYLMPFGYRLVTNAGTRNAVQAWLEMQAKQSQVTLTMRTDFAIIAVQGPQAMNKIITVRPDWRESVLQLKAFQGCEMDGYFIARTGYTGEEGLEIMVPEAQAISFWQMLLNEGVTPCGLAARDTLRLEAGMNLYGQDMDEQTNPLEAGLAWCIDLKDRERAFVGKGVVEAKRNTLHMKQVGLLLLGQGVLRGHQIFRNSTGGLGEITSGTFSPTLKQSIAIARVPSETGSEGEVEIRGQWQKVNVISLPFIRNGKKVFSS